MNKFSMSKEQKRAEYNKLMGIEDGMADKTFTIYARVGVIENCGITLDIKAKTEEEAIQIANELPKQYLIDNADGGTCSEEFAYFEVDEVETVA